MNPEPIRIGTRGSRLALWQADFVAERLRLSGRASEIVVLSTRGDRDLVTPLPELGDKALFTEELDAALLSGDIHVAVHSLKDLPTDIDDRLELLAVPVRSAPWDVLVVRNPSIRTPYDLPVNATIATSSLRRSAQLRAWRPDIRIVSVRGNVETRVQKLHDSDWDGMVLAEAGLTRLGLDEHIAARFSPDIMLPAVSQGALGVVSKRGSSAGDLKSILDDKAAHTCVLAERAFLRRLEGGCQVPIGAYATFTDPAVLLLDGVVVSLDGMQRVSLVQKGSARDPEALGTDLAERILQMGAQSILSAIRS